MNILHLTTFLQGGAGRILCDLALDQRRNGDHVWVMASRTEESGYCSYEGYIRELEAAGIPFREFDSAFKRDLALNTSFAAEVRRIIIAEKIDIIHAHAAIPALTGLIGRSGNPGYIPVIQTMHGWGLNKTPDQERTDITIMNGLDCVVAVSETDRNLLAGLGVEAQRLVSIYNGITAETVGKPDLTIQRELEEYRRRGFTIIGCIGTVCRRKNQLLLLQALAQLPEREEICCVIIGEGDEIPVLQEYIEKEPLHHVKLYGYLEDAEQYYKFLDIFVLPSTSEGFGLAIVEAYKNRVPVVASDIPVFCELVADGVSGFLFANQDANSLAGRLKQVLALSKPQLEPVIEKGFQMFQNQFRLDRMLQSYRELYHKTLNQAGTTASNNINSSYRGQDA